MATVPRTGLQGDQDSGKVLWEGPYSPRMAQHQKGVCKSKSEEGDVPSSDAVTVKLLTLERERWARLWLVPSC